MFIWPRAPKCREPIVFEEAVLNRLFYQNQRTLQRVWQVIWRKNAHATVRIKFSWWSPNLSLEWVCAFVDKFSTLHHQGHSISVSCILLQARSQTKACTCRRKNVPAVDLKAFLNSHPAPTVLALCPNLTFWKIRCGRGVSLLRCHLNLHIGTVCSWNLWSFLHIPNSCCDS